MYVYMYGGWILILFSAMALGAFLLMDFRGQ